jgi:hypothetical protein
MGVLDMLREVLIGAAGVGVGYLAARNLLEKRYARLLDEEIQRTKEFFGQTEGQEYTASEDPEFMEQAIKAAEILTEYSGGDVKISPAVLAQEVTKTVTAYNKPGAPSHIEDEARDIESNIAASPTDPDARSPYMIPFAEFDANETEAEQITVSFFAGDGIVIDEDDNVVSPDRVEQIIGTDNLNRFGTLTTDPDMEPNVIYVRCERFNMDFEVTRSSGKHSVEVLGQTG